MVRNIACLVGRHRWSSSQNRETQGYDVRCRRCGTQRHSFSGDPAFRSHTRATGGDGLSGVSWRDSPG